MNPCLLPGKVVWFDIGGNREVFKVWNYRLALNHSISFFVDLDMNKFFSLKVHFNFFSQSAEISF